MRKGNIVTIVLLLLFGVIVFFGMSGASVDIYRDEAAGVMLHR